MPPTGPGQAVRVRSVVVVLDRVGAVTKRPPIWAVVVGGLVWRGGRTGREAALRGGVGYAAAAVVANLVVKPLVGRGRPVGSGQARIGPVTSSFPSGHAATDLAFVFGVSQVVPALFVPLAGCTLAAHWSLARTRAHHLTDVLAGGAMGIGVALAVAVLWPSKSGDGPSTSIEGDEARLLVHIEPDGKTPSDRA